MHLPQSKACRNRHSCADAAPLGGDGRLPETREGKGEELRSHPQPEAVAVTEAGVRGPEGLSEPDLPSHQPLVVSSFEVNNLAEFPAAFLANSVRRGCVQGLLRRLPASL